MAANRQARQQTPGSTVLGKAMRWWLDGWVLFVRSGGGPVETHIRRGSERQSSGGAAASHD